MFGEPILLNFNRKGTTHKTLIGGFISLFVQIGLMIYLYVHVEKLVKNLEDKIMITNQLMDMGDTTNFKYMNETGFMDSYVLVLNNKPIQYNDDAMRYLTIKYSYIEIKSAELTENGMPSFTKLDFNMRNCTEEDFSRTEKLKEKYKIFKKNLGDIFICSEKTDFKLMGDQNQQAYNVLALNVMRCTPQNKMIEGDCASNAEIDEFIDKAVILPFYGHDHLDLSIRDGVPVTQNLKMEE